MSNDLQTLNERIAERIGKDLVELIPADQWQSMVDAEISKFIRGTAPKIIQDLLKEAYLNKAKIEIDKYCMSDEFNEISNNYTSSELKNLIGESGGMIFASVLTPAMQNVLMNLRNNLGY